MDNGRGENLLASVGLDHFLLGNPKPFKETDIQRADAYPLAIGRHLKAFCGKPEFTGDPAERLDFDLDEVCDAVEGVAAPDDLASRCAVLSVEDVAAVTEAVGVAQGYLAGITPKRATQGLIRLEKRKPSLVERMRFGRAWAIACNPLTALEDWNAGRLSRDQVTHFKAMFPALLQFAQTGLLGEFSDKLSKNEDWRLPRPKLRQVETLFQRTLLSPGALAELQKAYAESEEAESGGRSSDGAPIKSSRSEATATQRAEQA